jgi:alpha-beta hydrolase superfamily lysophospholipase
MDYREWEWRSADGTRLFACGWRPEEPGRTKGVVGIVHGMGEHSGRYAHVAEMLTDEGYAVLGFDQRGHGRTEGKRGHTPSYEALLEGMDLMLDEAARQYPGLPRYAYGHSMGGNVVLNYALRREGRKLAGAIATGPWLRLAFRPPKMTLVAGRIMERFYPAFTNHRPLAAERLTSDPDMARRYADDKLGHGLITARFFFSIQRAGRWALEHADRLSIPLLLMHGGDDQVTSLAASRQFAERAGPRCTFVEWPHFRHELHNELERERVFSLVRRWLNTQTDGRKPG